MKDCKTKALKKAKKSNISERQVSNVKKEFPNQSRKAIRNNFSYYSDE